MNRESVEAIKLVLATLNTAAQTLRQALEQPELTPEQLSFRAGYEQGRFDAQVEEAQYVVTSDTSQERVDETAKQRHETPKREWVGLTDEDKKEYVAQDFGGSRLDAMDWAEQRLKEKNT
jgi:hypothetical protein